MTLPIRTWWTIPFALALGACGSRTELFDISLLSAPRADAGEDAADGADAADASDAEPPVPTCTWGVGPTTQITSGLDDHQLTSAIHVSSTPGGGALVATMSSDDPATDRAWTATPLDGSGAIAGGSVAVFGGRPNGLSVGGLSLADGYDRRAAIAWDSRHGCRFAELDPSSSAVRSQATVSKEYCSGLHATATGYRWVESDLAPGFTHRLITFDGGARTVGPLIAPLSDAAYWLAVVAARDGATMAAWVADGRSPARIVATVLEDGAPADGWDGPTVEGKGRWIRLAPTDTGAIVVWLDTPPGATTSRVRFAAFDRATHAFGKTVDVADGAFRDAGVGLGLANGDVLVAWMEGDDTHAQHLYVQPLLFDGTPRAPRTLVHDFLDGGNPRLVTTGGGAIVAYEAEPNVAPMQVFATALSCPP